MGNTCQTPVNSCSSCAGEAYEDIFGKYVPLEYFQNPRWGLESLNRYD